MITITVQNVQTIATHHINGCVRRCDPIIGLGIDKEWRIEEMVLRFSIRSALSQSLNQVICLMFHGYGSWKERMVR